MPSLNLKEGASVRTKVRRSPGETSSSSTSESNRARLRNPMAPNADSPLDLLCNDTLVAFEEIPEAVQAELGKWSDAYQPVHAVAHWDDRQRKGAGDYERALEDAAKQAERLLAQAGNDLVVKLLEFYPAVVWE